MHATVVNDVRFGDVNRRRDLAMVGGRIVDSSTIDRRSLNADVIDGAGLLAIPSFVEPHLHLDKALLNRVHPSLTGTLADAIAVTAGLKAKFDRADILSRSREVLERAITNGTTLARVHAEVDPTVGLLSVEAMVELREEYRGTLELQIVAFPQEGIFSRPGTLPLLEAALRLGANVIGGCPYSERDVDDARRHVKVVFDLAERFGVPADFHADFADDASDARFALIDDIAEHTSARGLQHRVVAGHLTSLAASSPRARQETIARIADAGVSVIALPATDLHLGGRNDDRAVRRGITPIAELAAAGVRVAMSSNNVRNAFTPFGNVDQLQNALLLAQTAHLSTDAELELVLRMVTTGAAEILGVSNHVADIGGDGDLVLVDAARPTQAILDQSPRRKVFARGTVVAETVVEVHRYRARVDFS
ncbi:amidohydrolase family protein [Mycolicibacterium mengxianglii]|uniref:amidohydrolase family protein n=1 Tax=Mycolicibacterium mengxianglii TaxID=2736649 RepID=UPI0018EF3377|nr:amidohydrolase family protein [Mycolicibacterium mengxianglii]